MGFGTLAVSDLVRSANQNILDFGEPRLADYIGMYLGSYNQLTTDMLGVFMAPVNDRILGYGGGTGIQMVKSGEFGRADASKPTFGSRMGFPLELNQLSYQFTRKWLQNHTPMEMMAIVQDAMLQDTLQRQKDIKNALFNPVNRTVTDELVDNLSLDVKALANNDGFAYPPDPYGNAVAGAHNHYLARVGTLAASDIDAVIATVAEHYTVGKVMLFINSAQESAVRGFNAPGQFLQMVPSSTYLGANAAVAVGGNLDTSQTNNRQIGYWGNQAAEVWVKPWVPANYMIAIMINNGTKLLGYRERGEGGLHLAVQDEAYPLRCETMEAEYGIAVRDRLTAAVLFVGATTYAWTSL